MSSERPKESGVPSSLIYVLIAIAGGGPMCLGLFTGDYDLVCRLAETPVVVALVTFLVKMLLSASERARQQDEDRHREEREKLTQQLEHAFAVGSSSYMANVAFDKHVKFCEDYAAELRSALDVVLDYRTQTEAFEQAKKLTALRRDQALWLTPQMEEPLEKIERALRWIGGGHRIADDPGRSQAERIEVREKISRFLMEALGEELGRDPKDDELSISNVIRGLGRVLGVADLTALRVGILREAARRSVGS